MAKEYAKDWSVLPVSGIAENMLGGREKSNVILGNLFFKDEHNYLGGRISINAK